MDVAPTTISVESVDLLSEEIPVMGFGKCKSVDGGEYYLLTEDESFLCTENDEPIVRK